MVASGYYALSDIGLFILDRVERLTRSFSHSRRLSFLFLAVLFSFSIFSEALLFLSKVDASDRITGQVEQLLVEKISSYGNFLSLSEDGSHYEYNKGYQTGNSTLGTKASPKFSGQFPVDGSEGVTVNDPSSGVSIKIIPQFRVGDASKDENRLVYPLLGRDALKVVSLGGIGYKEDIVLNTYQGRSLEFDYELDIPNGIEARLEADGSVAFYGVRDELLGDVTTATEQDLQLLESAKENGEKTNLLFRIPAPYTLEYAREVSVVDTYFKLDGTTLTTVATNLAEAKYPLTIDPSVYVETARKFLRGNEETNVDFDVDNELIQKGTTTGARFNNWSSTLALNEGLYDGGSAVAGGYVYYVGGHTGAGGTTVETFTSDGTFNVPAGVTSVTVEMWGGGGGGGGGGTNAGSNGGDGGGGGYARSTVSVTPAENLNVLVGGGGGGGEVSGISGSGGGGGGHSEVNRGGSPLVIAPGGGGGGGGDNSGGAVAGGDGGAGGDSSGGLPGDSSGSAGGGGAATSSSGGSGGNGPNSDGEAGGSEFGGDGADGRDTEDNSDGSAANGGSNGGGPGGLANESAAGFGAGGGGGSGYYGGGGGAGSQSGGDGGGGGGSGVAYFGAGTSSTTSTGGSGATPGNSGDLDRAGAADGGSGGNSGGSQSAGSVGDDGIVIISYTVSASNTTNTTVYWANIDDNSGGVSSANPGNGACASWCTNTDYDLPEERRSFSLVAYNGFLYAIGGEDDSGNFESTVYIAKIGANGEPSLWHPTDDNKANWVYWYEDTSGALSTPTRYGAAKAFNNRLYFLGGETSGGVVSTVQYTDFEPTGTLSGWTTSGTSSMSTPRYMHSVEAYNDYLYVIGGDANTSGSLLNTVDYVKLANDGTFDGSWESTSAFSSARRTNGGKFTAVYGAYIYLTGGCVSVSSGYCQSVGDEIQIASIFADGSLGDWSTDSNETNNRVGYGLHTWQGHVYRVGGCTSVSPGSHDCSTALSGVDFGTINPPGEVSTVNITESYGSGNCTGATPNDCDLPATGDGSGQGGQMLSMSVILNGYLYVIGGCTNFGCSDSSGNVSYAQVSSDGSLVQESTCVANGNSYANSGNSTWCVDSTNRVNGTSGISAAGVTVFENRIYLVGGIDGTATGTQSIYWNTINSDGSLSGAWSSTSLNAAGITAYTELSYTYAYARANPQAAGTNPGNLYVLGGCTSFSASAGCSSSYASEVYKCNITTSGAVSGCTTSGQLQIDSELASESNEGLGLHSGTVYANYIYLIGGYSDNVGDRDTVFYARFDDSNNIVDVESGTAVLGDPDDDWIQSANDLDVGRRRGWAFGYNGHIYAVGGYDDTGTGIIPFIEWGKLNVSDGSLDTFVTSSITINQRWGLSMVVSNSFAYVVGGCDVGPSPGGCSSFEPSVQTFQLYNNDSGAQANYTEQIGNFATNNDRIGSSAAILDGYIYVAGGDTSGTATNNVQYAKLNANGTIGSWSDTTASLPSARSYGQLEVSGGTLYYVGGEDTAGDEKSEVYYATPTTTSAANDTIRSTTYKLNSNEFSGVNYTLSLNNNLESDYYVMVAGADDTNGTSGPDSSHVRVDGDPFGNLTATTAADEIRLERGSSDDNWNGTVTVVECIDNCATDGFQLREVIDGTLPSGDTSEDFTLSSAHDTNTVPFGGYLGGGLSTTDTNQNNFNATAGVRVRKNSTNQIRVERNDTQGTASAADITIYVVEWGSSWNVQEVNVDNWSEGGAGVDATGEYHQESISSVTGANTWVWKSPGTSEQNGLGDGAFGKVLTLGDGVADPTGTVTQISLGSRYSDAADVRDDTVYVMEHSSLAVDYRFHTESGTITFTETVDSSIEPETVSTIGNVTSSEGYRVPLFYYSSTGTGTAYTRVAGYSHYYTNDTTVSISRDYNGQDNAGWLQSVDFGNLAGSGGGAGDISTWSTASNGLPGDRTKHGAAVWNDRIYVVGGLNDSASPTNTVYISPKLSGGGNITTAWATDADVPDVARSGATVISYANNLYFLGGNDGTNYLSDVQFTTIGYKTGTISQSGTTLTGTGTTWTSSMVGSVVQYADGSYANVTGFTNATTLTVDASKTVDPGTRYLIDDGSVGNWTYTTNLTRQVSDADGFAVNGFIYLFGGRSSDFECTNNSYVAPISANTTIDSGNNPTGIGEWYQTNVEFSGARRSPAVAYSEGKVYISGGGCDTGTIQYGQYTFDSDNDSDESAWTFVSDNGSNGLNPANTGRAWSHDTNDTSSGNVGPTSGQGGNPDGYVYTEASNPASGGDTFTMTLNNTLNASTHDWEVDFFWNQRGDDNTAIVRVQTNEGGGGWVTRGTYGSGGPDVASGGTQVWNGETLDLASAISNSSTQVRFQVTLGSTGNIWHNDFGLDSITITGTAPSVYPELTSSQHYIGTLRAQPQVARYSYFVDADSDVFPNSWLLNGLDNNIGARWQFAYRSSTDAANTWGLDTDFGDVQLGRVEPYIPKDGAGVDTEFARYFYVTVSIDASQTFGYPDDVARGPTVTDMSLFFVSDPNKRLRHGKTFIQGLEQPLDTPCRVSGASPAGSQPNCPIP